MPASDRLWTQYEYTRAAAVIDELAKRDPGLLPRLHSAASGAMFSRIVDLENLSTEGTLPLDAGVPLMQASGSLLRAYLEAHHAAPSFAHEMAALQAFTVGLSARFVPTVQGVQVPAAEPGRSRVEQAKAQMISGLSSIVDGLLTSLAERVTFDGEDRAAMAASAGGDGVTVIHALPHLTQIELCTKMQRVALGEPVQDVRAALLRAQRGCLSR